MVMLKISDIRRTLINNITRIKMWIVWVSRKWNLYIINRMVGIWLRRVIDSMIISESHKYPPITFRHLQKTNNRHRQSPTKAYQITKDCCHKVKTNKTQIWINHLRRKERRKIRSLCFWAGLCLCVFVNSRWRQARW